MRISDNNGDEKTEEEAFTLDQERSSTSALCPW